MRKPLLLAASGLTLLAAAMVTLTVVLGGSETTGAVGFVLCPTPTPNGKPTNTPGGPTKTFTPTGTPCPKPTSTPTPTPKTVPAPGEVKQGHDLFETDSSETWQDLSLPADFFGPGCAPFSGRVFFQGQPLPSFAGNPDLSPTDTVVRRLENAGPFYPDTIPIEIVALSLVSTAPITVICTDGDQTWSVQAAIPEGDTQQSQGTMTVRHEYLNGGTFDSVLPVRPLITFTRLDAPGTIGPFYYPSPPDPPILVFSSNNVPWCVAGNPLDVPAGDVVIDVKGLTTNFFPGVICPDSAGGGGQRQKVLVGEDAALARHGVKPAERGPRYKCYKITGAPVAAAVDLYTQFGFELGVEVQEPLFFCPSARKNNQGSNDPNEPGLKCYRIVGTPPGFTVNLTSQFGEEANVVVGPPEMLCVPAFKQVVVPPLKPYYKCFDITGPAVNQLVNLISQFGIELAVPVLDPESLCLPALKETKGDLRAPHLKCYNIIGHDPPNIVDLTTQFGTEVAVDIGQATLLCVPVKKQVKSPPPTPTPTPPKSAKPGDSDGDGCSDAQENGPDENLGGRRDYLNPWDYFNPTGDGLNRVDDILKTVQQYFRDTGHPNYTPATDRTALGPNIWNLGPPDGFQRVGDILYSVKQYFHDCQEKTPPTPTPTLPPHG